MEVILAKNSGFCHGVKNAVDTVMQIGNKNVCVLGEIIHNETVLDSISKLGVKTINDISEISGDTVVIRSHGVGEGVLKELEQKNVKIINLTCPFVIKTQKIVNEYHKNGYQIVIIGKQNHPEVIGLNGWCDNTATILDDENVTEELFTKDKICVVSQTTYSIEKFKKILKKIQQNTSKTVAVFETICYTTIKRQLEANELSKKCDAMVVIGGANSSNTAKLYEICKTNCDSTFLTSNPKGLDYKLLKRYKRIGIVCGASTPYEQAMEVFLTMEEREVNSMEQAVALLNEKQNLKKGQKISVVISLVNDDGLKVYFDGKTDITLGKEELACEEFDKSAYNIGDEIEVVVMATKPHLIISQKQILVLKREEEIAQKLKEEDVIINVQITGSNKGGLIGKYEMFDVFVPAKEIKIGFVSDLTKYAGKTLRVKPLKVEYTPRKKEIVASQKVILEAEKQARELEKAKKEEEFFNSIALNDVVTGTVARFAQFGAFVVVNGFDCLAHISDLSWTNIKNPSEVLEVGKSYDFVVLKIDKENKKVSIGYKQLQPKPWDLVAEKYAVGDTVTGKIVRVVDFGAFVEIEKGVDGLVHVSQISHEFLEKPASILKVGEEVNAKILSIKPEEEKMNLSIKALIDPPKKEEVEENKPKKEKKAKKDSDEELHSWTESGNTEVSIADLLNK